ncbi:MAG: hypothetical protein PHE24_06805 [Patescibacteria group bacterium]|nr:hypothetical protein [Patescibacteria group bacterium]
MNKNIFLSILFVFFAGANFPLNIYALVNLPLIIFFFGRNKEIIIKIFKYGIASLGAFLLIVSLNFSGIKEQVISIFTDYHPLLNVGDQARAKSNPGFFESLALYCWRLALLFPLFIAAALVSLKNKVKNKDLLIMSLSYFFSYFFIISFVANWSREPISIFRYLFPLGFFMTLAIASFDIKFKKIFFVIGAASIIFHLFTLYYLSIPTSYNLAYDWVGANLKNQNITIVNKVRALQLIKNKQSSALTKDEFCATKCQNIINYNLNNGFKPLVRDFDSKDGTLADIRGEIYYIESEPIVDDKMQLVYSSPINKNIYLIDKNLGNYWDWKYLTIKNFGENIFIYKAIDAQ